MKLQDMMGEMQKSREEVHKNVVNYIKEYNKTSQYHYVMMYTDNPGGFLIVANDSLDITNDIVEGLNAQYKAKKEANNSKKK
jgi:outer membrane protein